MARGKGRRRSGGFYGGRGLRESRRRQLAAVRDVSTREELKGLRRRLRALVAANPSDQELLVWASKVLWQAAEAERRLGPDAGQLAEMYAAYEAMADDIARANEQGLVRRGDGMWVPESDE